MRKPRPIAGKDGDQQQRLLELIRARTPLFYLGSLELQRAQDEISRAASQARAQVRSYSLATYTLNADQKPQTMDPFEVLNTILKRGNEGLMQSKQVVWVLVFFHLLLRNPDAMIISRLREIIEYSRFVDTVIILGKPGQEIPSELSDIPVLNLPDPDRLSLEKSLSLNLSAKEAERIYQSTTGLSTREIENLLAQSMARLGRIDPACFEDLRMEYLESKGQGILAIVEPQVGLKEIGGLESLKKWLVVRGYGFRNPELLSKKGLPLPRGVLITGIPGCGKSLLCQAIAREWDLPLFRLDPSRLYGPGLGESEGLIRKVLELVQKSAPAILWIDEVEKGFARTDPRTDGGVSGRILGSFLHFLENRTAPVFVVATANDPTALPPEFIRKGRWDEVFFIDLPNEKEREAIYAIHLKRMGKSIKIQWEWVRFSKGFSGAEICQSLEDAAYECLYQKMTLNALAISRAIKETRPLSCLLPDKIQELRQWGIFHARPAGFPRSPVNMATTHQVSAFQGQEG
jgi:AAA+ superfamily predicted ATPase